jgi:RNA polymerase sigma factor (sigma-70 family)
VEQDVPVTAGDPEGLGDVYLEQAPGLWRALVAYTGSPDVADDALAEAFAQATGRGSALRSPERWVWTAAFRIAAGQLKDRSRPEPLVPRVVDADLAEAIDLVRALGKLSPRQRAVLILHYYGGYKTREIAEIVGSTAATVRVHLSVGRKKLRELLEVQQ